MNNIEKVGIFETKDSSCTITVWYKSRRTWDYLGEDAAEALSLCPSSVKDFLNNSKVILTNVRIGKNVSGKWYALGES